LSYVSQSKQRTENKNTALKEAISLSDNIRRRKLSFQRKRSSPTETKISLEIKRMTLTPAEKPKNNARTMPPVTE